MKGVDDDRRRIDESEETEALELILFQVSECYVYLVCSLVALLSPESLSVVVSDI